jgi:Carboxypeptidase regulatory-like domain
MNATRNVTRVLTLAVVALILSAGLFAQKKTREERREEANSRSVMGIVVGADDQPVNGAVVQLKDMRTLQVRSFITQTDGQYHFSGLRADIDYQLTAKSGEMTAAARTLSIFDNRKEAVMNFKLDKK